MDAAALARRARDGHAREVLPDLLALASDPNTGDDAWRAAAAAIEILFWEDRLAEPADLAENVIVTLAELGTAVSKQDKPFDSALLAAELYAQVPAAPRLRRLAGVLPRGCVLAERLTWLADRLYADDPAALMPGHHAWGGPPAPLSIVATNLIKQAYGGLKENQRRALWGALESANDIASARRLRSTAGEDPPTFATRLWLAGWAAYEGDVAEAERLVLAAAPLWWPYADWDCLPTAPVLEPVLRRAVTPRVRERYLTEPLAADPNGGR